MQLGWKELISCDIMKVMEDDQEIGAYMFRRTVPSLHLTPEDVRCMVCAMISLTFQFPSPKMKN